MRALVLAAVCVLSASGAHAQQCGGDCDGTAAVDISELTRCVTIALGRAPLGECDACDIDGNTRVRVEELVSAVGAALNGCTFPTEPSATARFELPADGAIDWGAVPFPSDLYRDASGAIRIGALPTAAAETALHAAMRDEVQRRDGFCATCNIYFGIAGELEAATVRVSDPAAAGDAVVLADVDPASPERGRLFPLSVEWDAERHRLAVRPVRGIALHRNRRYAAVLTTGTHGPDGSSLGPSPTFRQARGRLALPEASVERARVVLAPFLDELERVGIGRNRIVALAGFTTEDVTRDILAARAAVQGGAALDVSIERRRSGADIDELLGVPSEDRPGVDVPPAEGTAGARSVGHDAIAEVITGVFRAPRIVTGAWPDIGTALRDANGDIVAGAREAVPFLLTLPKAPAAAQVPVVIVHHGFSSSRAIAFASAATAARVGIAVLAVDGFQHGNRAASTRDEVNSIRGVPGADGFAETEALDVSAHVFGLSGAAPGLELFPAYSLGAFLQFGADVASAVRVLRDGTLAAAVRGAGVANFEGFSNEHIGFIGNSMGSIVGTSLLTADPDVRFAVLNVPPGSIVETLAESPEFRGLVDALFLPILGVQGPFDEVQRHLLFDPLVDLSRWILEPIDPLALAPYLLREPVRPGGAPEILFQVAGLDEVAAPRPTQSMLAATGSTRITLYDPAAHSMLEVLNQTSRFEPPAVPPFVLRPEPIAVVNPLVEEHAEIAAFLDDVVAGEGVSSDRPVR